MEGFDRWDVLILVVAGYLAIMSLVRMMAARRRELVGRLRAQAKQRQASANKEGNVDSGSKAA